MSIPSLVIKNWGDLERLKEGSHLQRAAHLTISESRLDELVRDFQPLLVGDMALGLASPAPLIKVICQCGDLPYFSSNLKKAFWNRARSQFEVRPVGGSMTALGQFQLYQFTVRITAQQVAVQEQIAFKAFRSQLRLLEVCKPEIRLEIEKLRQAGMKIDWAFAKVFNFGPDPRKILSEIANLSDQELAKRIDPHLLKDGREAWDSISISHPRPQIPTRVGNFRHFIRLGIWGWLIVKNDRASMRMAPEIRHSFDEPGALITLTYVVENTPRETLAEVTSVTAFESEGQSQKEIQLKCRKRIASGEYPVIAVWARKKRMSDLEAEN